MIAGPLKEITISYNGDFMGLDLSPVTTRDSQGDPGACRQG